MDKNFTKIEQTLIGLTYQIIICEEITKNGNCMQGEFKTLNEEMAVVFQLQSRLVNVGILRYTRLMNIICTWLGDGAT